MTNTQHTDGEDVSNGDPLDEPIDIGDRFRWGDEGGVVEILSMSITEDGVVQVRVDDDEKRTVTASDLVERVSSGELRPLGDDRPDHLQP
jgi:hypothetical protein